MNLQTGVVRAVDEFLNEVKASLNLTGLQYANNFDDKEFGGMEADTISWFIEKNNY